MSKQGPEVLNQRRLEEAGHLNLVVGRVKNIETRSLYQAEEAPKNEQKTVEIIESKQETQSKSILKSLKEKASNFPFVGTEKHQNQEETPPKAQIKDTKQMSTQTVCVTKNVKRKYVKQKRVKKTCRKDVNQNV